MAHGLHLGERHRGPVEPAVGADGLVERGRRDVSHHARDRAGGGAQRGPQIGAGIFDAFDSVTDVERGFERSLEPAARLRAEELEGCGRRAGYPARCRLERGGGLGREHHGEQIDAGDAVDHCMVHLGDDGEAIPALQALDYPHLPERPRAVELLRHDAGRQPLELAFVSGARQRAVAHVVLDVEMLIVDPHRAAFERREREHLAVAGDVVEA